MGLPILSRNQLQTPDDFKRVILDNFGIQADVVMVEGRAAIKVDNHLSLFSLITAIRRDFAFEVYSKPKEGFILYIK